MPASSCSAPSVSGVQLSRNAAAVLLLAATPPLAPLLPLLLPPAQICSKVR